MKADPAANIVPKLWINCIGLLIDRFGCNPSTKDARDYFNSKSYFKYRPLAEVFGRRVRRND